MRMSLLEQEMQDREHPVAEDIALQRKVWSSRGLAGMC